MEIAGSETTWSLLRSVAKASLGAGVTKGRLVRVAAGSVAAGALAGLVPAFVGLGVSGLGTQSGPATGLVAPLARALEGRPAWLWIVCALVLVTITVLAALALGRAGSHLSADLTAKLRVVMTHAALSTSPRSLEDVTAAIGGPAPPPGIAKRPLATGTALGATPLGMTPPSATPKGPGGPPANAIGAGKGSDLVKIAILRDSQGAAELLVAVLTNLPQGLTALVAIGVDVSASGSWLAFVLGAAIFFLSRLLSHRASRRVGGASAEVARADAAVLSEIGEKLGHLEDLRLLGARGVALSEVRGAADRAAGARRSLAEAMAVAGQTAGLVTALAPLVVLMTLAVSHAAIAPAEVARLLVAVPLLVGRMGAVDAIRIAIVERRPVLAGVAAILALPPSPRRASTTFRLSDVETNDLAFEAVTFRPPGAARSLLDHVSLTLPRGAVIGICGTSGGGKTTLLRLLLRLDEPSSGRVTIGGRPLDALEPEELPELFAVATQGSRLLQRSVEENLALGRRDDGKLRDSARRALVASQIPDLATDEGLARKFVRAPPSLSGGEERRVVVARAFGKPTGALVLDEPEAGLPRATARAMLEALAAGRGERTLIVVTHAPELLPDATLIVLDSGKIVGTGTHDELVVSCPTYANLYGARPADDPNPPSDAPAPPG